MATVTYPTTSNFGALTARAVGKLREALADLNRVKSAGSAVAYGADQSPTWSRLETNNDFSVGSGGGQSFYDGVNGLCLALETADAMGAFGKLDKGA